MAFWSRQDQVKSLTTKTLVLWLPLHMHTSALWVRLHRTPYLPGTLSPSQLFPLLPPSFPHFPPRFYSSLSCRFQFTEEVFANAFPQTRGAPTHVRETPCLSSADHSCSVGLQEPEDRIQVLLSHCCTSTVLCAHC